MQRTGGIVDSIAHRRHFWLLSFDAVVWVLAMAFAALARLDFNFVLVPWHTTSVLGLAAAGLFTAVAWVSRLHDGRAPLGSLDETILLGAVTVCVGVVIYFANLLLLQWLPRSVPLMATLCAVVVMAWARAMVRAIRENAVAGRHVIKGQPVLVIGAGSAGRQLIRSMHCDPKSRWYPVGVLDDDPHKRHLRIDGVAVLGTVSDLPTAARQTDVSTVVIAIPSADAPFLRCVSAAAADARLAVKVLPDVNDLLHGRVGIQDVRDIDIPDLLGRRQIDTDIATIAGYLSGQRVLVTGAGGSIGSELCRQIARWEPACLIMLDRDESALHAVQLSIEGRAMLDCPNVVLADIRDQHRIQRVFEEHRPDVVFHAAALKHLPMLEQYPAEAIKTNVWGTAAVLEAARRSGVQRFVNISTDKAANPVSVLGYTKRIAEGLTAAVAAHVPGTYLSVRFGNVLGSRGSVLTAFAAQIAAGGPVTVTDPGVTRYFMTVDEAVQLVIQAAVAGRGGEALVLDMGEAVSIDVVARHLIELSGREIVVEYTGLRRGEKLHEDLFNTGEPDFRPLHPLISHVTVPPVERYAVHTLESPVAAETIGNLRDLCLAMSARACQESLMPLNTALTTSAEAPSDAAALS